MLPLLNQKLGLEIPSEQVVATLTVILGYILQSAAVSAKKAGVAAAVKVATIEDAKAVFEQKPGTVVNIDTKGGPNP